MAKSDNLRTARQTKQDEFYTRLEDIEKELMHYKKDFYGKTVFCNCDDPFESNFFKFFAMNFNFLGLRKLICTCYATSPVAWVQLSLFDNANIVVKTENGKQPYKIEITEVLDYNGDGAVDLSDVEYLLKNKKNTLSILQGDGDFRSQECIALLEEADIVVTNPPFSLFREYVAQLIEYNKKFIIIGSKNAIAYKEVFPLIRDNKIWLGYGFSNGNAYFKIPSANREYANGVYDKETGLVKFRNCGWYTNIDTIKRHEELILYKTYSPDEYPSYSNYQAINVNKTAEIPCDYFGVMGVPVTFLDVYNPEQFEIIGLGSGYLGQSIGITGIPREHKQKMKGHSAAGDLYYMDGETPIVPYSRILIRRKK